MFLTVCKRLYAIVNVNSGFVTLFLHVWVASAIGQESSAPALDLQQATQKESGGIFGKLVHLIP